MSFGLDMRVAAPFLAFLVLLLSGPDAWAFKCQDLPLMQLRTQDGKTIRIHALDEQMERSPIWDMEKRGEPPLRLSRAVATARKWAEKKYKNFDEVRIGRISLHERRCGFARGRWFYIFDFDPVDDGKLLLGTGHFAAVLMDGTIIGPNDPPSEDD